MQQLDQQVWVSPQIQPADVETIAAEGFKAIVCNRPDGEEPGQPDWASVEAAAKAAGLRTYYLPMASREVPADTADGFAKYPPNDGTPELRTAFTDWLARRYEVTLDPDTQVMPLNGTREGLFNACLALCPERARNGDTPTVLIPNPFYQVYAVAAAAAGADGLAEAIGSEGKVAAIIHDQTSATGIGRRDGFLNRMEEAYPNIEIVDVQYANDALKATETAKAMLQANPDLKGIFASNEGAAIGLAVALKETGADIVGVGFDSGKSQNPVGIGECVVDSLAKALAGETLPEVIDTGFYWYDKDNMDDPQVAAVLYD